VEIYKEVDLYQQRLNEYRPFEGDLLQQIKAYYRVSLIWSSNALEGNTLTMSETKVLLEEGLTASGKPLVYSNEAVGHAKSYDYMFSLLRGHKISEEDVLTLHKLLFSKTDEVNAGVYRNKSVIITGSKYPVVAAPKIQFEIDKLFNWINNERASYHPIEFAAQLHKRFVFIHPFIDGNGRIARLLMNTSLIQDGYMLAVIPPILRNEYIALLEKAHIEDMEFNQFIAQRVIETQKDIMRLLNIPLVDM